MPPKGRAVVLHVLRSSLARLMPTVVWLLTALYWDGDIISSSSDIRILRPLKLRPRASCAWCPLMGCPVREAILNSSVVVLNSTCYRAGPRCSSSQLITERWVYPERTSQSAISCCHSSQTKATMVLLLPVPAAPILSMESWSTAVARVPAASQQPHHRVAGHRHY